MNTQEVTETNRMIAKFMGYQHHNPNSPGYDFYSTPFGELRPFDLKYDRSWDWIMTVIDKIYELPNDEHDGYNFNLNGHMATIENMDGGVISEGWEEKRITAVWVCVVKFINWYNNGRKHISPSLN